MQRLPPALVAVDLGRWICYYDCNEKVSYEEKHAYLPPDLEAITHQHREYRWRRVTIELRRLYGHHLNHKVLKRLLGVWDLRLTRSARRTKPSRIHQTIQSFGGRANLAAPLKGMGPFQVMCTDSTELRFADARQKAHMTSIIDHVSRMAYGWDVGGSPQMRIGSVGHPAGDRGPSPIRCYVCGHVFS